MSFLFWGLVVLCLWSLAGYGIVWVALARLAGRREPVPEADGAGLDVTMLIAARNEEAAIAAKLASVLSQDCGPHRLRVVVVSDGSEDATLVRARAVADARLAVFETQGHGGKAAALSAGLARIGGDVVIFSDANSLLEPGAIRALMAPFADPAVGGVCGRPRPMRLRGGWLAGVEAMFWRYDSALKAAESALGGAVSAQGTLYALRRELVPEPVPSDMADDFYISVQAPAAGLRLAFAPAAVAIEAVTARTGREFLRRVRSTERGWRALWAMRRLMNPLTHGLYAIQLVSHKLARRLVALALPILFGLSLLLGARGQPYLAMAAVQLAVYGAGLLALFWPAARRVPGFGPAAFFLMGHAAMALGILRAATGFRSTRWSPVREAEP
ncbi:MAG: glycosyltransferase family 2 protein [Paracoccaceae bacterium]